MTTANLANSDEEHQMARIETFKSFVLQFHYYCIQADYRNLAKNSETRERRLLKETITGNIGAHISNAGQSFAGDPLNN